jgi:hypothetical protein
MGEISTRQAAKIAGIGYLVIFFLAIFANFFVVNGLVVPGDAATSAANVTANPGLFRAGLVSFAIVFIVDVFIAWALYVLFRPLGRDLSLLAAWFRIVYTVFLGIALVFFFMVLALTGGAGYLGAFDQAQIEAQVMMYLDAFSAVWLIGLVAFGVHLILVGRIILKSGSISRVLGIILMVAGSAYILDTVAHAALANYQSYATVFLMIVAVPSVIGELSFTIWLFVKGGRPAVASPSLSAARG